MQRLQLLLATRSEGDGPDLTNLTKILLDEFSFIREHQGGTYRLALREETSRAVMPTMGVPEFEAVLELGVPDETGTDPLVARAAAVGPKIAPYIDGARSAAVLGRGIDIVPGEGVFELFRCMSRKETHTLEQFSDHWLHIHSEFGKTVPGRPGYGQLHRNPAAQTAAARAAGVAIDTVDGVATLLLANEHAVSLLGSDPAHDQATAADGALFVDRTKAMGMISRVVVVAGPLP